jgi:hypothetical protein
MSINNTLRLRLCIYSYKALGRTKFVTGNSGFSELGVGGVTLSPRFDGLVLRGTGGRVGEAGRLGKALAVYVNGVLDGLGPGSTGSVGNALNGVGEGKFVSEGAG